MGRQEIAETVQQAHTRLRWDLRRVHSAQSIPNLPLQVSRKMHASASKVLKAQMGAHALKPHSNQRHDLRRTLLT